MLYPKKQPLNYPNSHKNIDQRLEISMDYLRKYFKSNNRKTGLKKFVIATKKMKRNLIVNQFLEYLLPKYAVTFHVVIL